MNKIIWVMLIVLATAGCASTKVQRIDVRKVTDLSGEWNDTDARFVAQEMIHDCLQGGWLLEFNRSVGRIPTVIVGDIRNKTYEHISTDVFINDLQKALIDSGRVDFVANKEERASIRDERRDQQMGNTEPSTISAAGHEVGADFMLQGDINAISDSVESQGLMVSKKRSTSFFQVALVLIDLKTNQKRWIGKKEIKKSIEQSKVF